MPLTTQNVMVDDSRQAGATTEIPRVAIDAALQTLRLLLGEALDNGCYEPILVAEEVAASVLSASKRSNPLTPH